MRAMILPMALLSLGAMPAPNDPTAPPQPGKRACPQPVTMADSPAAGAPMMRKLGEMPPARHIAAVHTQVYGCPVMLVLDAGQAGGPTGWVPAPEAEARPVD